MTDSSPAEASRKILFFQGSTGLTTRSQLLLLQILIAIVLAYHVQFSQETHALFEVKEWVALGLLLVTAALPAFPARWWEAKWMVGTCVLANTLIVSGMMYFSPNVTYGLHVIYFLIILIAASAPTLKQVIGFSVAMCAAYGVLLYLGPLQTKALEEGDLLEIPILLIMGVFYGIAAETVRQVRRHAEQALRESEVKFRSVVQLGPDAVILINSRGTVVSWNKVAQTIFGYTEQEAVGEPLTLFMPERYREAHLRGLGRFLSTGESYLLGHTVEFEGRRKDGSEFPLELSFSTWTMGGETCFSGILRDVTERKQVEAAVQESQERYRRLLEGSLDAIFVNKDARVTYINKAGLDFFGATDSNQILGRPALDFFHQDDHQTIEERTKELLEAGRLLRPLVELRVARLDGKSLEVEAAGTLLEDEGGSSVQVVLRDISSRRRMEELGRQALIFRSSQEGILVTDDSGVIKVVNPAAETLFGYTAGELLEQRLNMLNEEWTGRVLADLPSLGDAAAITSRETRFVRNDGTEGTCELSVRPLRSEDGLNTCYVWFHRDITAQKEATVALRQKTEQLEAITHSLTSYLETGDCGMASKQLLRAALKLTGSECGFIGALVETGSLRILEYEGIVWSQTVNREFYDAAVQTHSGAGYMEFHDFENLFGFVITGGQPVLGNNQPSDSRAEHGLPQGFPPLDCFLGVPILKGDKVVGMIGVANRPGGYAGTEQEQVQSLTHAAGIIYESYRQQQKEATLQEQSKQLERQLRQAEKLAEMGTLLGGVAHELNNPLFIAKALLQVVQEDVQQGRHDSLVEDIRHVCASLERASGVISRFLRLARTSQSQLQPCSVNLLINDVLGLLANTFLIQQVILRVDLADPLSPVMADPQDLSQVFLNLLTNACQAMEGTSLPRTLSIRSGLVQAQGRTQVEIRVGDTGRGIAAKDMPHIFNPFFTTKPVGQGTGLGLSISYQTVVACGGGITAESQEGKGATFIVRLPAANA